LKLLDIASDEIADAATPTFVKRHPNTYTFTKNCAEDVVRAAHLEGLPIAIVRPSIVTSTWKEPYVGWTDTFAGPPGLMTAAGSGMARVVPGRKKNKFDVVPVDTVANFLVVAAWHTHMRCSKPSVEKYQLPAPILNCVSGTENPSTCGKWVDSINKAWIKYPMKSKLAR
jgi:fatty acyl-CoA reductase